MSKQTEIMYCVYIKIARKIKKYYKLYMKGARENHFPISEYGFLGEKYNKHGG